MVHEHQIGDADMAEIHAHQVDPELIRPFRVKNGDVLLNMKANERGCFL